MDVWIALVGTNGPKLYDVAMLVCWYNAPLEEMLKLNGASSGIMLNNIKTSAVHGMSHVASDMLYAHAARPTACLTCTAPLKCCHNLTSFSITRAERTRRQGPPNSSAGPARTSTSRS